MKNLIKKVFLSVLLVVVVPTISWSGVDCRILSVNSTGNQHTIVISLEGLPKGEVFVVGQVSPSGQWQENDNPVFSVTDNGNDTATISIQWPAGESWEFSYGRGIWSPTIRGWANPDCSKYEYDGHFKMTLGIKPPIDFKLVGSMATVRMLLLKDKSCRLPLAVKTGDQMILGVEDLGDNTYRLYLNFNHLPGAPFFMGQSAPDSAWESKEVTVVNYCHYVDIRWQVTEPIHFSWYGDNNQEKMWADARPEASQFSCPDGQGGYHFCLPLPLQ